MGSVEAALAAELLVLQAVSMSKLAIATKAQNRGLRLCGAAGAATAGNGEEFSVAAM